MQLTVYKDPLAIRFIRCVTPIPGADINAAGAGWTLQQAIARCESELIERDFEINELWPSGVHPVGIAAHLDIACARERATQEAVETLCLKEIQKERAFRCGLHIRLGRLSLGIARTQHGYFSFIRGFLDETPIAAYTAASTAFTSVIKAWEEFQSIRFCRPQGRALKTFSKAHMLFQENELASLPFKFEPRFVYRPNVEKLTVTEAERSGRKIVYLTRGENR